MKINNRKTNIEITNEWNQIADQRYADIKSGIDVSYEKVLKPEIINNLKNLNTQYVLDFGCGTGNLTYDVSKFVDKIDGYDISQKSLQIARESFNNKNLRYLDEYSYDRKYTTIFSNMVFMDVLNLKEVITDLYHINESGGTLLFTIIHPCFWPIYWEYNKNFNFDYKKITVIEEEFKISEKNYNINTTHVHRPLEFYINTLITIGYSIKNIKEMNSSNTKFIYPRFLLVEAKKL